MQGQCLCGAVTVSAVDADALNVCHCGICRRWGSGPFLAVHAGRDVIISGQDKVTAFKSSDWAERGFCSECGTHLYYLLLPTGEYMLSAGLFQDKSFNFTTQVFIDNKPDYYAFANQTRNLTGAEAFAEFSPD